MKCYHSIASAKEKERNRKSSVLGFSSWTNSCMYSSMPLYGYLHSICSGGQESENNRWMLTTQQLCGFGKSTSLSLLFVKCILLEVCSEAQINLRKYVYFTTCYIWRGTATVAITSTIFPRAGWVWPLQCLGQTFQCLRELWGTWVHSQHVSGGRLPCIFCMGGGQDYLIKAASACDFSGSLPDLLTSRSFVGTFTTPRR